ncbi:hypothetical protein M406DRAFT_102253 [Cryphonectria parasitica EP155]|uniref:Uncharacterized protein n=1 Tax=Cryphonectria parasitica (strain ATCC 38755 / EP155) TaxID=660469 RepID=A0A9P4Y2M9_CRYP1|nr:uncharacterized protein M406DRAFT_102253 [Cryphonectria parasitica EP155]KAF3765237.1 hypothetical protein M406DRAFT_102253 [Cryphonectria parasitica EP155]
MPWAFPYLAQSSGDMQAPRLVSPGCQVVERVSRKSSFSGQFSRRSLRLGAFRSRRLVQWNTANATLERPRRVYRLWHLEACAVHRLLGRISLPIG